MASNDPQTFLNGYLSAMRNSIITSSLGVAIYGFSRSFKKKISRNIMKRLSILVYIFSFIIMLNTVLLLRKFLSVVSKKDVKEFPKYVDLKKWKVYEYLGWFFTVIVFLIITLGLSEDVKDLAYFVIRSKKRKR
jgi:hypothetical protein